MLCRYLSSVLALCSLSIPLMGAPPAAGNNAKSPDAAQQPFVEKDESLQNVPEVRLFTDDQVQDDLDRKYQGKYKLPVKERPAFVYKHNLGVHRSMVVEGLREGLPLQSKGALLPTRDAAVMQMLSKELRDLGFVSSPSAQGTPAERAKAFNQWCADNHLEKFAGVPATIVQMLQIEDLPVRLALVEQLAKVKSPRAGIILANRAVMDLSPDVRCAAVRALKKRAEKEYLPTLIKGLRYPWPPVAEHSADALSELKPKDSAAALCDLLEKPDPRIPFRDPKSKRLVVAELVRINHLRNCLLCHAPSASDKDGLVRGSVPAPPLLPSRKRYFTDKGDQTSEDATLERMRKIEQMDGNRRPYYTDPKAADFIRADITFLHQDFSANMRVEKTAPWPEVQRFDFVVRLRPATPEEVTKGKEAALDSPQRRAVLRALRKITGKDGGNSPGRWQELLGITTREK